MSRSLIAAILKARGNRGLQLERAQGSPVTMASTKASYSALPATILTQTLLFPN